MPIPSIVRVLEHTLALLGPRRGHLSYPLPRCFWHRLAAWRFGFSVQRGLDSRFIASDGYSVWLTLYENGKSCTLDSQASTASKRAAGLIRNQCFLCPKDSKSLQIPRPSFLILISTLNPEPNPTPKAYANQSHTIAYRLGGCVP